jgi:hypothetical protein
MKSATIASLSCVVASGLFLLLSGCGFSRYDFHVSVSDARGLSKGSPVVWQDTYVGEVSDIKQEGGAVRLEVTLQKTYRKTIRSGVKACPILDKKITDKPILFLIGGRDATLPLLAKGSQIPEASLKETTAMTSFWGWIGGSSRGKLLAIGCAVAVIIGVIALKFLAGLLKIAILVGAILLVVFSSKSLRDSWETYKASWNSAEVKQWISDHMKDVEQIRNMLPKPDAEKPNNQN